MNALGLIGVPQVAKLLGVSPVAVRKLARTDGHVLAAARCVSSPSRFVFREAVLLEGLGLKAKPAHKTPHDLIRWVLRLGACRFDSMVEEARETLFREQQGMCAICGAQGPFHLDHDHRTLLVRGLSATPSPSSLP